MKVTIDCGHGGAGLWSYWKIQRATLRAHAVLDIGLRLTSCYSCRTFVDVQMIREERHLCLSLPERCRMANEWGADIFVSIHLNSATSDASGFEVFTSGSTKSKALAKRVWSRHTTAFPDQKKPWCKDRRVLRAEAHRHGGDPYRRMLPLQ